MANAENSGTERLGQPAGQGWERATFGSGSVGGTIRLVVYVAIFVVVFGTLFYFARG